MAQADIDRVLGKAKRKSADTFNINLLHPYSMSISRRRGEVQVGIYKSDSKCKKRGVVLPLQVWQLIDESKAEIQLAIDFVGGNLFSTENNECTSTLVYEREDDTMTDSPAHGDVNTEHYVPPIDVSTKSIVIGEEIDS